MSDETPPQLPPQTPPAPWPPPRGRPGGAAAATQGPANWEAIPRGAAIDAVLRQPGRVLWQLQRAGAGGLIAEMLVVALVCSLVFGVVVGTFSGGVQLWAAPVKIAGGLLFSAIICLPSLYIFACLSGAEITLRAVCGLVAAMLALMTLLLVGFAPVAWLFAQSTESVVWMGTLDLAFAMIAAGFGLRLLQAGVQEANARSTTGLNFWVVIFMLVVVQMTTTLRPIVGTAPTFLPQEKKFFLSHWSDCINNPPPANARPKK